MNSFSRAKFPKLNFFKSASSATILDFNSPIVSSPKSSSYSSSVPFSDSWKRLTTSLSTGCASGWVLIWRTSSLHPFWPVWLAAFRVSHGGFLGAWSFVIQNGHTYPRYRGYEAGFKSGISGALKMYVPTMNQAVTLENNFGEPRFAKVHASPFCHGQPIQCLKTIRLQMEWVTIHMTIK